MELTVGYVAGIIAACFFIANQVSPTALALLLSWRLQDKSTAATWTVAGAALQQSHWPTLLSSDSTSSNGVSAWTLWSTRISTGMTMLLAVGAVVTPLGLYSTIVPDNVVTGDFVYARDFSPFGYGTPPRSNHSWSRLCLDQFTTLLEAKPCPFSSTVEVVTYVPNMLPVYEYPYGISTSVSDQIVKTFSSGVGEDTTISNFFDIHWRRYATKRDPTYDNGSAFLVADNRNIQPLLLNNVTEVVEGLVVDAVNGAIGFRNHTVPIGHQWGVQWDEDLLFVEPETVCVDTNLTLDFTFDWVNTTRLATGVVLTDRGGFVNLDHTYPTTHFADPQANPDLYHRAYMGAWLHNAYTALYFNVTDPINKTAGSLAWSYLNSELNKTFQMLVQSAKSDDYNTLSLTFDFDDLCAGVNKNNTPGIDTILVACGQLRGVPQRTSPGSGLVQDTGIKATIKTTTFSYNRTDGGFPSLTVVAIGDKDYTGNPSAVPLWGVEKLDDQWGMLDLNPIWGIVSDDQQANPNVSTVRQPSLYLPGYFEPLSIGFNLGIEYGNREYLPGSDFSVGALMTAYTVKDYDTYFSIAATDYSGSQSLGMWSRWQNLSASADSAALIANLIFTDSAAAAVVGSKGALGSGNAGSTIGTIPSIRVTPVIQAIRYNLLYAIPAFLTAAILLAVLLLTFTATVFGAAGPKRLRRHLQLLSAGRIYTVLMKPNHDVLTMPTKEWVQKLGNQVIDFSGLYVAQDDLAAPQEKKEPHHSEVVDVGREDRHQEEDENPLPPESTTSHEASVQ
ncbi:hypothetical protein GQ53DRAFT_791085 [Thozetella sp. PMI_491]|nr:hypothetical protein GQ53DRAFT_791085 [Thozetella sp. PMI_491]